MVTAALWDVLAKVANLAQLSGVHAVMLLAVGLSLLRIPQCIRERAELERCVRRLSALLPGPAIAGGCEIVARHPEMEDLVFRAVDEAYQLVRDYDGTPFWSRLRRGRTMAGKLRDMHSRVDSCCFLVLFAHAFPPPSDVATWGNVGPPAAAAAHERANDIGREELLGDQTDDTDPGYEIETAIMISNE